MTASFGGMIADVMAGYRATIARQAHWIGMALAVGSTVYVIVELLLGFWPAVAAGVLVVATLRYVSQVRDWPSLPWPGESRDTPDSPPTTHA